jgi:hypothetical protein
MRISVKIIKVIKVSEDTCCLFFCCWSDRKVWVYIWMWQSLIAIAQEYSPETEIAANQNGVNITVVHSDLKWSPIQVGL